MRKWLISSLISLLGLVFLAGCSLLGGDKTSDSTKQEGGFYTVQFELCTTLETNEVPDQEVEEGDVVMKPSVGVIGANDERMEIDGWYTDAEYTNEWNFTMDVVEADMTLYAKWIKKFAVVYYLGEEVDTPMYTRYVKEGELIPYQPELADGYQSKGFFAEATHKTPFNFDQPITKDVNVYIHRSESIYFSGKMIAERFEMFAAPSGPGSTVGTIEYVEEEEDDGYAKINFGYSTAGDPYALLRFVTVDISQSQQLEVTFKNLGKARSMRFYYLTWMEDGSYTAGQAFSEDTTFTYYYEDDEMNMSADDEWVTKVFDFSSVIHNGVSNWGISSTLVQLRLQSGYVSESPEDLSNEVWIKSIKGIPDSTYTSTEDTDEVKALCVDDKAEDLEAAGAAQDAVNGWIFPKDHQYVTDNTSEKTEIYKKTNGILWYSKFRVEESTVSFKIPEGQTINLNEKTTIKLRLTNYGYANKIKLTGRNNYSRIISHDITISPCGDTPESKEYILNMFGVDYYEGNLLTLSFAYDSVGVNNAILIESIEFCDFKLLDIPGVNLNDKYAGVAGKEQYWTTANDVLYMHNDGTLTNGGTVFTTGENAYVEKDVNITSLGYKTMTLKYKDVEGVSAVKVAFTIGGSVSEYVYDVSQAVKEAIPDENGNPIFIIEAGDVKETNGWYEIFLPLTANGTIENVKITFVGAGTITVQEIRFHIDRSNGVDFSDSVYTELILARDWDDGILSYNNSNASATLSAFYDGTKSGVVRYYFGSAMKDNKFGEGNIDLSEKSKVIVVYNNMSELSSLNVGLGIFKITDERDEDSGELLWPTAITEASPTGGILTGHIRSNMAEDEWDAVEYDLNQFPGLKKIGVDQMALTEVLIEQGDIESKANISIRAIIVL